MKCSLCCVCLTALLLSAPSVPAASPAPPDEPLPATFPPDALAWSADTEDATYQIPVGPVTGYRRIDAWETASGHLSRRYYRLAPKQSHGSLFQDQRQRLLDAGFELLAEGFHGERNLKGEIGGVGWLRVALPANPLPSSAGIDLVDGTAPTGSSSFLAARRSRAQGDIHVAIAMVQRANGSLAALLDVVYSEPADAGLRALGAAGIAQQMQDHGRVVLNGLRFETGGAALMDGAIDKLAPVAEYLRANPGKRFFLVGHSDATGALDQNRKLSAARARAVARLLAAEFGIPAHQLDARGVGPLSPLFSNDTAAGRDKNRRVELVER